MSLPDPSFLLARAPVVPVVTVPSVAAGVKLARALTEGGLPLIEVTLRTPVALDVVRAMAEIPGGVVGAGTILDPAQAREAVAAGAKFLVSPGATPAILDAALELGVPLLPGVATASEAMAARERGFKVLKFFPAGPAGGPNYLKALASPLGDVLFCPTGGVSAENARDYLKLSNVVCVGGSWVAPADAVAAGDWARVEALAREAAAIRS